MLQKDKNRQKTLACTVKKDEKNSIKDLSVFVRQNAVDSEFRTSESWVILSPVEQRIKEKIEAVGTPLKDWDIQINYGIKTGYNEAFIISGEKRAELIAADSKSAEIIRPILRGRDIKRYGYEFADLYLLFIPWHFPLQSDTTIQGASEKAEQAFENQYPAIYNHLLKYKKELSARNKAETGIRYEWYALQRWGANYWEDFYKQKIVWGEISDKSKFALDDKGLYPEATSFLMTGSNLKYLLAIFNSKLGEWIFNLIGTTTGVGTNRWKKYTLERLPVKEPTKLELVEIEKIINIIIKTHSIGDIKLLDKYICQLYGLSQEEIAFIESQ
jgi:hypothetical protein